MPWMQLEINDEDDKTISLHKINGKFRTKADALRDIIQKFKKT